MAAGGAAAAVTGAIEKCVLAETGGDKDSVAQFERHNELRVRCPNAGDTLGMCKAA